MADWSTGGWLEQRAAVAALAEPRLLRPSAYIDPTADVIPIFDAITECITAAAPAARRDPDYQVLRQALAYAWSVLVAANPSTCRPAFERWLLQAESTHDKDLLWIARQNLKKNRLLVLDESLGNLLGDSPRATTAPATSQVDPATHLCREHTSEAADSRPLTRYTRTLASTLGAAGGAPRRNLTPAYPDPCCAETGTFLTPQFTPQTRLSHHPRDNPSLMLTTLRQRARAIKRDTLALYLAARHPDTPWYAKALAVLIVGYALSPIDLIPDFIPVLGYLDDVILLPAGIFLCIRLIPAHVLDDCRARGRRPLCRRQTHQPHGRRGDRAHLAGTARPGFRLDLAHLLLRQDLP